MQPASLPPSPSLSCLPGFLLLSNPFSPWASPRAPLWHSISLLFAMNKLPFILMDQLSKLELQASSMIAELPIFPQDWGSGSLPLGDREGSCYNIKCLHKCALKVSFFFHRWWPPRHVPALSPRPDYIEFNIAITERSIRDSLSVVKGNAFSGEIVCPAHGSQVIHSRASARIQTSSAPGLGLLSLHQPHPPIQLCVSKEPHLVHIQGPWKDRDQDRAWVGGEGRRVVLGGSVLWKTRQARWRRSGEEPG